MKAGSNVKLVSKLHIVDLSGSERVHKTGVTDENIIAEAKAINSGLFNL
jgi:hypothetical protein